MTHFQNRYDIIEWLIVNIPKEYATINRALGEGSIEFLGGFSHIPPGGQPGWIIQIQSKNKKNYYVAIIPRNNFYACYISILKKVPWQYWDGCKTDNKLYQGDNPKSYRRLMEWHKNQEKKN